MFTIVYCFKPQTSDIYREMSLQHISIIEVGASESHCAVTQFTIRSNHPERREMSELEYHQDLISMSQKDKNTSKNSSRMTKRSTT
jgi:hypothetical protein